MHTAILNAGDESWIFEEHAQRLAQVMHLPIRSAPVDYNYLLGWESQTAPSGKSFIPYESILLASDKRLLTKVFAEHQVATPRTYLLESEAQVQQVVRSEAHTQWVLKWPTGCGATGHRLQKVDVPIPKDWPRPYVLQEFIDCPVPEVYRLYCVSGETFGWNARRFPAGAKTSPFVAHAQGARYEAAGKVPTHADKQARRALEATGLLDSFGCADLMKNAAGQWLVLEVNTDGLFNHVDRDINIGNLAHKIDQRLADAFWSWVKTEMSSKKNQ